MCVNVHTFRRACDFLLLLLHCAQYFFHQWLAFCVLLCILCTSCRCDSLVETHSLAYLRVPRCPEQKIKSLESTIVSTGSNDGDIKRQIDELHTERASLPTSYGERTLLSAFLSSGTFKDV